VYTMWDPLDKFGKILAILIICFGVCFLILTIQYAVAIADAVNEGGVVAWLIVLYVLSAVVYCIVAACGFYASCKMHQLCLQQFAIVNIVMWIFCMIQLIVVYITMLHCGDSGTPLFDGNPWAGVCQQTDDLWFWLPQIITIFLNACSAFAACGMKYKVQQTSDPSLSGGSGAFFG